MMVDRDFEAARAGLIEAGFHRAQKLIARS
jgi:hypothetical protein